METTAVKAQTKMQSRGCLERLVRPTVLPPDQVRSALLAINAALQACKMADWKRAPIDAKMNAAMLVDLIIRQLG